jgi:5-methyltetrahydropteroyltriglutamate--homocysteine methyltransferase
LIHKAEVQQDIARLRHAVGQSRVLEAFIPATSPGCVTMCAANKHYGSYEDYLWAVADAMAEEYRAIVNAGFAWRHYCRLAADRARRNPAPGGGARHQLPAHATISS